MLRLCAVILALSLTAAPASAQRLDLSTIKCGEFLQSGQENIALILMWLTGYFADQEAPPIVDFTKMKTDSEKLGKYCAGNPEDGLITAAEEIFE